MHTFWLLCTLAALMAAAPAKPARHRAPGPAATIRQEMEAQAAAWNRGDVDAFMAAYWRSPRTQFIGAGGITTGWTPVRERYLKTYPDRAAMGTLTFSDLKITLLCPDYAYVVGHFHLQRAHDQPHGVFTLLFRRFPQGWRIISDHTTATP
ncbi:MAG: YybH family protein [Terriglobales bacterium]